MENTKVRIFIASAGELKEEREKCILLLNQLNKSHSHLNLEPIEWEYDITVGSQPGFDSIQDAINPALLKSDVIVFLFYSRIGENTLKEFELATKENKKLFVFFKKGFSPEEEQIENYGKLFNFKKRLNNTVLKRDYLQLVEFEKHLLTDLGLFLAQQYPVSFPTISENNTISSTVSKLVQILAEKEELIKKLEQQGNILSQKSFDDEVNQLKDEVNFLKNELSHNEEVQRQQAIEKEELKQQLAIQQDRDELKAKALLEIEKGNYSNAEVHLKESAAASISETAATFYELAKIKKLQFEYQAAFDYYELAAKIDRQNHLYLLGAGSTANDLGYFDKAISYFERVLNIGIAEDEIAADCYENLGVSYIAKGEYQKAIELYEKALKINIEKSGAVTKKTSLLYTRLGEANNLLAKYDNAIGFIEKAMQLNQEVFKGESEFDANNYNELGVANYFRGYYQKAISFYTRALEISKKFHQNGCPDDDAYLNNMGRAYQEMGYLDEAIQYYEKAILSNKKFRGDANSNITTNYSNLGYANARKGEYENALGFYNMAFEINKKFYGEEHPNIATDFSCFAQVYNAKAEYEKALGFYEKALAIDRKFYGEEHPNIATDYSLLAEVYKNKAEYDNALKFYQKALDIDRKFYGNEHPNIAINTTNIGAVYYEIQEYAKALQFFEKAITVFQNFLPPEHADIQNAKDWIRITKEKLGN